MAQFIPALHRAAKTKPEFSMLTHVFWMPDSAHQKEAQSLS